MEDVFSNTPLYRHLARLNKFASMPNESTVLRFRNRLGKHKLIDGTLATVNELLHSQGLMFRKVGLKGTTLNAARNSKKQGLHAEHRNTSSKRAVRRIPK